MCGRRRYVSDCQEKPRASVQHSLLAQKVWREGWHCHKQCSCVHNTLMSVTEHTNIHLSRSIHKLVKKCHSEDDEVLAEIYPTLVY